VYLLEEGHVLVAGVPVAESALLRDYPRVEQLVAHALDAYGDPALAYLASRLLAVELGQEQRLHRAKLDALA